MDLLSLGAGLFGEQSAVSWNARRDLLVPH